MSEETERYKNWQSSEILRVIGHRGGVSHALGSVILQLSVASTEDELSNPTELVLSILPETVDKLIASLQQSADILRQSN